MPTSDREITRLNQLTATNMTHAQIKSYARSFRKGILGNRPSTDMCFAVTAPLVTLLQMAGVECALEEGMCGSCHHFYIRLADGNILDPTGDQFELGLPPIYLGTAEGIYTPLAISHAPE